MNAYIFLMFERIMSYANANSHFKRRVLGCTHTQEDSRYGHLNKEMSPDLHEVRFESLTSILS